MGGTEGHVLVNSAMTGAAHRRQGHGYWVGGIAMGHGYWSMTGACQDRDVGAYLLTITGTGGGVYCGFRKYIDVLFFRNVD